MMELTVIIEVMQSRDTRRLCHHFGRINNGMQVITNHLFSCVLLGSSAKFVTNVHKTE